MNLVKTVITISACAVVLLTIGCSNPGDTPLSPQNNQTGSIEKEKYVYGDKTYEISYSNNDDKKKQIAGSDADAVKELMKDTSSGLVKDPKEENVFWIYKNESERAVVINLIKTKYNLSKRLAKTTSLSSYAALYRNANYNDGSPLIAHGSISNVGYFYNDQISSLYIQNCDIVLYQDQYFGGHSITFISQNLVDNGADTYFYTYIPNLGWYTMVSYWVYNTSWNDQMTSLKLYPY